MKDELNNQPFPFVFVDTGSGVIEIHPAPSKSPSIEELFYFLAVMASQGGFVVCHGFLPYMDLDLSGIWKVEEGISVLRKRWELAERLLKRQCEQREPWLHVRHDLGTGFIEFHRADSRWDLPGKMRFCFYALSAFDGMRIFMDPLSKLIPPTDHLAKFLGICGLLFLLSAYIGIAWLGQAAHERAYVFKKELAVLQTIPQPTAAQQKLMPLYAGEVAYYQQAYEKVGTVMIVVVLLGSMLMISGFFQWARLQKEADQVSALQRRLLELQVGKAEALFNNKPPRSTALKPENSTLYGDYED